MKEMIWPIILFFPGFILLLKPASATFYTLKGSRATRVAPADNVLNLTELGEGSKKDRFLAVQRQLAHSKDHFESLVAAAAQSAANLKQQAHRRQTQECTQLACETFRAAYEVSDTGVYVVGGFCKISESSTGKLADAVRLWQDELVPRIDQVLQFGLPSIQTGSVIDACFSPALVGDAIEKTVNTAFNPCFKLKKAKNILNFFRRVDRTLTMASRLPYIKIVARLFKTGNDKVLNFFEDWTSRFDSKCSAMNGTLRDYAFRLFNLLEDLREAVETIAAAISVPMDVACAIVQLEESLLLNRPAERRRFLKASRYFKELKQQGGVHDYRRLNFDEANFNSTLLSDSIPFFTDIGDTLNTFGSCLEPVIDNIRDTLTVFNDVLDNSVLKSFSDTIALAEPVMLPIFEIVDKLSFLQCPTWLGFICDLDSLVIDAIVAILDAIGIPVKALEDLITDLIANVYGPLDGFPVPDNFFPDLSVLDDLTISSLLLAPLQDKLGGLEQLFSGSDLIGDAFSDNGEADIDIPGVGELEFFYKTGTTSSIAFSCPATTFPYVLAATANNDCGFSEFSGIAEVPCGIDDQSCDLDLDRFGGLPLCNESPSLSNVFLDIIGINPSGSRALHICLTKEQFADFDSLPSMVDITFPSSSYSSIIFQENFDTGQNNVRKTIFNALDDGQDLDIRTLFKPSFDYTQNMACPGTGVQAYPLGVDWRHAVTREPLGSFFSKYFAGFNLKMEGEYLCLVPERDIPDDDFFIDFHVAYRAFGGPADITQANDADYPCGTDIFCTDYYDFDRENAVRELSMTCQPGEIIQVMEVLTKYSGLRERDQGQFPAESFLDQTYEFTERCRNSATCSFQGDTELRDKVCDDNGVDCSSNFNGGVPPDTIRGRHYQVYRATYECLETCSEGYIQLPDKEEICVPCGAGLYRDSSMETCEFCPAGTFSDSSIANSCTDCPAGTYSTEKGATACTACPAGTVTKKAGAATKDDCEPCPTDTYSDGSTCVACSAGQTSEIGSIECFHVKAGSFNSGSSGTKLCPPGSYSEKIGSTGCTPCSEGTYMRDYGATECILCAPATYGDQQGSSTCKVCPAKTASKEFGATTVQECEEIPPTIQYSSFVYDNVTCEELLMLDLVGSSLNETELAEILAQRLSQKGDGICNGIGPWNTKQCNFDGGDCCPASCVVPDAAGAAENKLISDVACQRSTFICLDPKYSAISCSNETVSCDEACEEEETAPMNCSELDLSELADERKGDGLCDECLNVEEHEFDGGDCCTFTCTFNPAHPSSCSSSCKCKVDREDIVDTVPPQIVFEAYPEALSTVEVSEVPRPPLATALDNNEDTFPVDFSEDRTPGRCNNEYTLTRQWDAYDDSNNRGTIQSILQVVDNQPPIMKPSRTLCLVWAEVNFGEGRPAEALYRFSVAPEDRCGEVSGEYCSRSTSTAFVECDATSSRNACVEDDEDPCVSSVVRLEYSGTTSSGGILSRVLAALKYVFLLKWLFGKPSSNNEFDFKIEFSYQDQCGNTVNAVDNIVVRPTLSHFYDEFDYQEYCEVRCSLFGNQQAQPYVSCACNNANTGTFCSWEDINC